MLATFVVAWPTAPCGPSFKWSAADACITIPAVWIASIVLDKLLNFHQEHHTPPHEILRDLQHAAEQIPQHERVTEACTVAGNSTNAPVAVGKRARKRSAKFCWPYWLVTVWIRLESNSEAQAPTWLRPTRAPDNVVVPMASAMRGCSIRACAKLVEKYGALSGAERRIRQRGALSPVFTRLARTAYWNQFTDRDRSCGTRRVKPSLSEKPPSAVALLVRAELQYVNSPMAANRSIHGQPSGCSERAAARWRPVLGTNAECGIDAECGIPSCTKAA